ncbi:hypothetical protein [Myxococcus landrumensis]|uniref:Uncharacterized protein n=1 Tax=Myxococcus landrumensis TaxID=2813577 RepID=A0ABX7NBE6_9BACT|nr:hypothetical protein [Myxococcus landrumus]QSQ13643.1 hypothetical protein JY572_35800 [Myxococcus landrumus]
MMQQATRVGRALRSPKKDARALARAPRLEQATVIRPRPPALPLDRCALVTWILARERAEELLEGLGTVAMKRAKAHLRHIVMLPSPRRQAKVATEFGERADAGARLKDLMAEVPEALRKEIFRNLPPYHRSLFPGRRVEPSDPLAPPLLSALAARLVREATR